MKTNAKLSRATVQRAQPRTVTAAISISIYLHLATSTGVSSGTGLFGSTARYRTVSLLVQ